MDIFLSHSHQQTGCKLTQGNRAFPVLLASCLMIYVLLLSIWCHNQGFGLAIHIPVFSFSSHHQLIGQDVREGLNDLRLVHVILSLSLWAQCYMDTFLTINKKWSCILLAIRWAQNVVPGLTEKIIQHKEQGNIMNTTSTKTLWTTRGN